MSRDLDRLILRSVDGLASKAQREALSQAAQKNPEVLRQLQRTQSLVAGLGHLERSDPPRDLVATARAAAQATPPHRFRPWLMVPVAMVSAAAAVVVVSLLPTTTTTTTTTIAPPSPVVRMVTTELTGEVTHTSPSTQRRAALGDIVGNGHKLTTALGAKLGLSLGDHRILLDEMSGIEIIDVNHRTPSLMVEEGVVRVQARHSAVETRMRGILHRVLVHEGEVGVLHDRVRTVVTCIAGSVSITGPRVSETLIAGQELNLREPEAQVSNAPELGLKVEPARKDGDTLEIVGHVTPNSQVHLNGALIAVDALGRFTASMAVPPSGTAIELWARDARMHRKRVSLTWSSHERATRIRPDDPPPIETKWRWHSPTDSSP